MQVCTYQHLCQRSEHQTVNAVLRASKFFFFGTDFAVSAPSSSSGRNSTPSPRGEGMKKGNTGLGKNNVLSATEKLVELFFGSLPSLSSSSCAIFKNDNDDDKRATTNKRRQQKQVI